MGLAFLFVVVPPSLGPSRPDIHHSMETTGFTVDPRTGLPKVSQPQGHFKDSLNFRSHGPLALGLPQLSNSRDKGWLIDRLSFTTLNLSNGGLQSTVVCSTDFFRPKGQPLQHFHFASYTQRPPLLLRPLGPDFRPLKEREYKQLHT